MLNRSLNPAGVKMPNPTAQQPSQLFLMMPICGSGVNVVLYTFVPGFGVVAAHKQPFAADIDQAVAGHVDHGAGVIVNHAAIVEKPKIRAAARAPIGAKRRRASHHRPCVRLAHSSKAQRAIATANFRTIAGIPLPTGIARRNRAHIP